MDRGGVSVAMAAIHVPRLSPNTALWVLELLQEQPGSGVSHCLIKPGPGPDASGGAVTGLARHGPAETPQTFCSLYDPSSDALTGSSVTAQDSSGTSSTEGFAAPAGTGSELHRK